MTMIKSLILGSAAGLVALSGAQAADLPVKAKAVEYVRICSLYGAGFFYIPGTDTCIKLGGYLRVDTTFNGAPIRSAGLNRRSGSGQSLSRLLLFPLPYGAHGRYPHRHRIRRCSHLRSAGLVGSPRRAAASGTWTSGLDRRLNSQRPADHDDEMLFIQFAGFTFGRSASAYATPWHGYPGNNTSFLVGGHDTVTGTNNIQYTAQFGNGVSGTIGLDDPLAFNRTSVYNLATTSAAGVVTLATLNANGAGANAYGGVHTPDIVGNIRVDQAWGLFQLSGALHEVNASYNALDGWWQRTPSRKSLATPRASGAVR